MRVLLAILFFAFCYSTTAFSQQKEETSEILSAADISPVYPGGYLKMIDFIESNLEYPKQAIKSKTTGKVFVQFVVNKDGTLGNYQIIQGIGSGCDQEAIRILQKMPNWFPGKKRDELVRVEMVLPIDFDLYSIHY